MRPRRKTTESARPEAPEGKIKAPGHGQAGRLDMVAAAERVKPGGVSALFKNVAAFLRPAGQDEAERQAQKAQAVLRADDLHKVYGGREVVKGVSPELRQGEVVGLLGPNGAGKTTTFYLLLGVVKPSRGEVFLNETRITNWPLYERARAGLSYLPQESSIFRKLTVWENMQIILDYTDLPKSERTKRGQELLEELGIARLAKQKAAVLSGGERRRLETARALIRNPSFILLDEPFAGIDPLAVDDIQLLVRELKAKGIGVLISDHNVRETLSICDRAYLVFDGQIIFQGTPEEIVADPRAKRVYLGEDFCL